MHELSARRDNVRIELELVTNRRSIFILEGNMICPFSLDCCFPCRFIIDIFSSAETTRSLLIHLRTGGHSVNCEINQLPGADKTDYFVGVVVDILENLGF